jgi:DNA (cytosine-5)-methyltransferase 1
MGTLTVGSMFSGYGGLELGIERALDAAVAWHAEIAPPANRVLDARFPGIPNLGDVSRVTWSAVKPVDVIAAGFPCQDVANGGLRRGIAPGTRSGLWSEVVRAIAELRPSFVVIENVRGLTSAPAHRPLESDEVDLGDGSVRPALRALGAVLGDLADLGFDAEWIGLRASDVGAPHGRLRVFLLASPTHAGGEARDQRPRLLPKLETEQRWRRSRDRRPSAPADAGRLGLGADPAPLDADGTLALGDDASRRARSSLVESEYGRAVRRWEARLGRPAPAPALDGRVDPRFVEWMMGLPVGWVTDPELELSSAEQLRLLGNGVVPQQAEQALRLLLARERR